MRRARILKAAEIQLGHARPVIHGTQPEQGSHDGCEGDITVELRRVGDLVEAILVACPCGRTTEVECLYDALETDDDSAPDPSEE